nr:hypothetical protein GCM10020093_017450 [Planobispora longispora]
MRAVQLHGDHPHEDFTALRDLGLTLVRAGAAGVDLRCGAFDEDLLIVDAPRPGSGEPWDWAAVRGRPSGRWMLAGGLDPANVAGAIAAARPWGWTCRAGWRARPGSRTPGASGSSSPPPAGPPRDRAPRGRHGTGSRAATPAHPLAACVREASQKSA